MDDEEQDQDDSEDDQEVDSPICVLQTHALYGSHATTCGEKSIIHQLL